MKRFSTVLKQLSYILIALLVSYPLYKQFGLLGLSVAGVFYAFFFWVWATRVSGVFHRDISGPGREYSSEIQGGMAEKSSAVFKSDEEIQDYASLFDRDDG